MGSILKTTQSSNQEIIRHISGKCTPDTIIMGTIPAIKRNWTENVPEHRVKPPDLKPYTAYSKFTKVETSLRHRTVSIMRRNPCSAGEPYGYTTDSRLTAYYPTHGLSLACKPNVWLGVRNKLMDAENNMSGYLGEYKETANLFYWGAVGLKSVWDLAHARRPEILKKLNPKHKFSFDDVSAAWVNGQFAIKPIVNDIFDLFEYINDKRAKPQVVKISHGDRAYATDSKTTGLYESSGSRTETQYANIEATRSAHPKTYIVNLADAVWEGIPGSVFIDWLIPVGKYLESMHATDNYVSFYGTISTKVDELITVSYLGSKEKGILPGESIVNSQERPYTSRFFSKSRSVVTKIPMASFPRFHVNTDMDIAATHVTTGLAILYNIARGKRFD